MKIERTYFLSEDELRAAVKTYLADEKFAYLQVGDVVKIDVSGVDAADVPPVFYHIWTVVSDDLVQDKASSPGRVFG